MKGKSMGAWRMLGGLLIALAFCPAALAQTYPLAEASKAGDCYRIQVTMNLTGEMRVTKDKNPTMIKLAAAASHDFPERILVVDSHGVIQKVARDYTAAKAAIVHGNDRSDRGLRPERHLFVAQHYKGQDLVYSPIGSLTREELELVSEHFDTLSLPGLLPGRQVKVGETWKIGNEIAQDLCHFEGLSSQDITCKLESVRDDIAHVSMSGSASGIELGAVTKLSLQGTYEFDLKAGRLSLVEWKQKDERSQGPASPAITVESITTLKRQAITQPENLGDVALISVPDGFEPPAGMTMLTYHHDQGTHFDLGYSRDWEMVSQTKDHVILRMLDRGDFVAQATVTPWARAKPGEHLTPEAFREAMARTPGWEQGEVVQEGELPVENGRWVYRVSAPGRMDGLNVVQNFFLVAGPTGDQVVIAFTMTPSQVEKLGSRDLDLVRGLELATGK
jgi:hypothetical protein